MRHFSYRTRAWLQHRWHAGNRHAVHSPFVFELVEEVLRQKAIPQQLLPIEDSRHAFLRDQRTIIVADHGAGSHRLQAPQRRVAAIAATALQPTHRCLQLAALARFVQAQRIVELGTSLGISTRYLASAPGVQVDTIEGCPATHALAQEQFACAHATNISAHQGLFVDVLPQLLTGSPIDLAFIDGHHTGEATCRYFDQLLPHMAPNGVLVLDDIHWSPDMGQAWERIKAHPAVSLTIDLFDMGYVFLMPRRSKEHFRLTY